jgi:hypothetical protein
MNREPLVVALLIIQTNNTNVTDVMSVVDHPAMTWALVNGSAKLDAAELDAYMLAPFNGNMPPTGAPNITRLFAINQTDVATWVINGQPFSEPTRPIIYGNVSDGWNAATTLHTPPNSIVDIIMNVATDSMDTVSWSHSLFD